MTMAITNSEGKPHFATLDGLRGIAALSVVILHWLEGLGYTWFGSSWFAVDFFFMLSGFVIAHSYEARLKNGFSFRKFMLLRIIRLYPMIVLGALLGFLRFEGKYYMYYHEFSLEILFALPTTLLMIPESWVFPNNQLGLFYLNIAFWSLFCEFIAYIFYGSLVFRFKKVALIFIALISFMGVCFWLGSSFGLGEKLGHVIAGDGLFRVAFSFTIGVILFRNSDLMQQYGKKLPSYFLLLLPALFVLPRNILPWYVYAALMLIILPISIMIGVNLKFKGLANSITNFLGEISYPLYAIHTPVLWMIGFAIKKSTMNYDDAYVVWFGLIVIPITIAIAYIALKMYDEPVRRWLKKKVSG